MVCVKSIHTYLRYTFMFMLRGRTKGHRSHGVRRGGRRKVRDRGRDGVHDVFYASGSVHCGGFYNHHLSSFYRV